ncbi:ABC transporter ATP-binding protein [Burkholderia sp. 22PA0099]|uniref:ABC transporter ATP-binding protein n=1 Tax=Burkholderia sp. 22PA0099 TaxID=3237372 RepID=UPI0039C389DE
MSAPNAHPRAAASLACEGLRFRRGAASVLDGIDLHLRGGELVALLGVNGAGKSTLLRLLFGAARPAAGRVLLDGTPLAHQRRRDIARRIAYVPQHHVPALPHTVEQIVALGRLPHTGLRQRLRGADRDAIDTALERMQVAALADRDYAALSGGERQRVLLARALAQDAPILLMDEPLTGLDYGHQLRLHALLADLAREGYAILHTTHRPDDACHAATRVVVLDRGRLAADGAPHDVLDATAIGALYGTPVEQFDIAGSRFFRAPPFPPD